MPDAFVVDASALAERREMIDDGDDMLMKRQIARYMLRVPPPCRCRRQLYASL